MKRFALISDLHYEWWQSERVIESIANKINALDVDFVVNAGDIYSWDNWKFAEYFKSLIKHPYLYVPGNHDYYGGPFSNFQQVVQFDDVKVCLTTLWTNFRGVGPAIANEIYSLIADQTTIKGANDATVLQRAFRENLSFIEREQPDVVISHFMPFVQSTAPRFVASGQINYYFCNDLSDFVMNIKKKPKVWCCGHTHWAHQYEEQEIRVYCNPLGYPHENFNFQYALDEYEPWVIEV